MNNFDVKIFKW